MNDVTRILAVIEQGDTSSAEQLLPLVYDELRKLATQKMAGEAPGQTLQPTALVHEAYLRLVDQEQGPRHWDSRGHFFAAAAEAMRRILIENARRKQSLKHGGGRRRVELHDADLPPTCEPDKLLALNDAVDRLATDDPTASQLVKLHVFGGLSVDEAADVLGESRTTAYRQWTYARAWLRAEFRNGR